MWSRKASGRKFARALAMHAALPVVLLASLALSAVPSAGAQPLTIPLTDFVPGATNLAFPRVAVADDGSVALALEVEHDGEWKVAVQRYSSTMQPVGPLHFFEGCGINWTSEFVELPEIAFHPAGYLIVILQQTGDYHLAGDSFADAEIHIGVVDANGQRIDTAPGSSDCVERFVYFDDGSRTDRPRLAVAPSGEVFVIADGFFGDTNYRNTAFQVMDSELNEIEGLLRVVPHTDELSAEALHWYPDLATNGSVLITTWHECPFVDNQGNYADCDVRTQLVALSSSGLEAIGGNQTVNDDGTAGTYSVLASAAVDAAGNSIVVWLDDRPSPHGSVHAQRFNASGEPVGGNVQISAGQNPLPSTDQIEFIYRRPEVAMLGDGRFMVAWTEMSSDGTAGRAMARRYAAGGIPLEPPRRLLADDAVSTGLPHVTAAGDAYAVTWIGVEGGAAHLFLQTLQGEPVARGDEESLPTAFRLEGNYPNPFNPSTTIRFELPEAVHTRLSVHDLLGREVRVLVDGMRPAGRHAVRFEAGDLPTGTYLYRLEAGRYTETRLATLLR